MAKVEYAGCPVSLILVRSSSAAICVSRPTINLSKSRIILMHKTTILSGKNYICSTGYESGVGPFSAQLELSMLPTCKCRGSSAHASRCSSCPFHHVSFGGLSQRAGNLNTMCLVSTPAHPASLSTRTSPLLLSLRPSASAAILGHSALTPALLLC